MPMCLNNQPWLGRALTVTGTLQVASLEPSGPPALVVFTWASDGHLRHLQRCTELNRPPAPAAVLHSTGRLRTALESLGTAGSMVLPQPGAQSVGVAEMGPGARMRDGRVG